MDDVWKSLSLSYEYEGGERDDRDYLKASSRQSDYILNLSRPKNNSATNSSSQNRSNHRPVGRTQANVRTIPSKAAVAGALEASRTPRPIRSRQGPSVSGGPSSCNHEKIGTADDSQLHPAKPSSSTHSTSSQFASRFASRVSLSQESRNDHERLQSSPRSDGHNIASSSIHSQARNVHGKLATRAESTSNKSCGQKVEETELSLSQSTLSARADEIIMEAQRASSRVNSDYYSSGFMQDQQNRALIQRALDSAAMKIKGKAEEAVHEQRRTSNSATPVSPNPPKLRSTKEVLQMASSILRQEAHKSQEKNRSEIQRLGSRSPTTPVKERYYARCLSPTDSDVGSIDDYEKAVERLPSRLEESDKLPREKILQRIDGIVTSPAISPVASPIISRSNSQMSPTNEDGYSHAKPTPRNEIKTVTEKSIQAVNNLKPVVITSTKTIATKNKSLKDREQQVENRDDSFNFLSFFWGGQDKSVTSSDGANESESLAPVTCGARKPWVDDELPATVATSLVRVMSDSDPIPPTYAEAVSELKVDPRMPTWIENQFAAQEELPGDGSYHLGSSRTVIVHEIQRGNWTWATCWSPDGTKLAIATENHHLAVVETNSSSVWRVRHDKKISGPVRNGTTHSIRSIAWGRQFIAIGGTGNAVSILAPTEPYPILHVIKGTGFVGSIDWLKGTNTLLIGSRIGKAMIVKVWARDEQASDAAGQVRSIRDIQSTVVHTIEREKVWINAVAFSPGGTAFAIGDGSAILGVHTYKDEPNGPVKVENVANFKLEDSIMAIEWSPDGQWLYAGGEDFSVTVINTTWWEAVHRIKRDRWVQFISSSRSGSHIAMGGVSSEVSILEVDKGWDTALNVSLKGLVPLSAQWHPQDQYLVLTGQNNSVLAVETTNARYVTGHYLRSVSPILAIEFSPDGRMAAIGNEAGVVTIFKLSGTTFITSYELVLDCDCSLSIKWSLNGAYVCIVAGNKLVIIAPPKAASLPSTAPPNISGFSVAKVIRPGKVYALAIDRKSRFIAVAGAKTCIFDSTAGFQKVAEWESPGVTKAASWSPDGNWLALIGQDQNLCIYDTSSDKPADWFVVFTVQTAQAGLSLAWGPVVVGDLQYCAFGGESKEVRIMEIRTKERSWETVVCIPREGIIHDLDWNSEGLVAAAVGNGTVAVMDLSYLQAGCAVNEMNYNWQRQALTCLTEIRRNRGKNAMQTVRWIPSAPGSDSLLAVGGTDGELEIIDLTERKRCSGFAKVNASM